MTKASFNNLLTEEQKPVDVQVSTRNNPDESDPKQTTKRNPKSN